MWFTLRWSFVVVLSHFLQLHESLQRATENIKLTGSVVQTIIYIIDFDIILLNIRVKSIGVPVFH